MAKKPKNQPVPLVGMPSGGITADGRTIWFTLITHTNTQHDFSCPHEAIAEIISKLSAWADMAWKARGAPKPAALQQGTPLKANASKVTGFHTGLSKDGVVFSIQCGGIKYEVLLNPRDCKKMGEILIQSQQQWEAWSRPH